MKNESDLKPCPLCGYDAYIDCYRYPIIGLERYTAKVACINCACNIVGYGVTKEEAINNVVKLWNTRERLWK